MKKSNKNRKATKKEVVKVLKRVNNKVQEYAKDIKNFRARLENYKKKKMKEFEVQVEKNEVDELKGMDSEIEEL